MQQCLQQLHGAAAASGLGGNAALGPKHVHRGSKQHGLQHHDGCEPPSILIVLLTVSLLCLQGVRVHPHRVVRQQGGREEPASQAEAGAVLSFFMLGYDMHRLCAPTECCGLHHRGSICAAMWQAYRRWAPVVVPSG